MLAIIHHHFWFGFFSFNLFFILENQKYRDQRVSCIHAKNCQKIRKTFSDQRANTLHVAEPAILNELVKNCQAIWNLVLAFMTRAE